MTEKRIIGTIEVKEPEEWRQSFETASWFRLIRVEPGTYPVAIYPRGDHVGHSLYVLAEGVCTRSHFVSRLFQHLHVHDDEDVGKRYTVHKLYPPYNVQLLIDEYGFTLTDEGLEVREWSYAAPEGETRTLREVRFRKTG